MGAFRCGVLKGLVRQIFGLSICEASELTSIFVFDGLEKGSPYSAFL